MKLAFDSGVLIQAGKCERARTFIRKLLLDEDAEFVIPAPVLAEVIRGGPTDAVANQLIKTVDKVANTTEAIARDAGRRIGNRKGVAIDALIVATAEAHGATDILTTDVNDISRFASDHVNVFTIP